MPHEIEAILNIITADKSTLKSYHCMLLISGYVNLYNSIILSSNFKTLIKLMRAKQNSSVMSHLEHPNYTLIIPNCD